MDESSLEDDGRDDQWIGWNSKRRARNLQYIVNNSRFLILPWVQVQNLASTILAPAARQLPIDWQRHYVWSHAGSDQPGKQIPRFYWAPNVSLAILVWRAFSEYASSRFEPFG